MSLMTCLQGLMVAMNLTATALGANWRVLDTNGELVDVSAFPNELATLKNIPMVRAGSVYLDPETGAKYLMVTDQAMYSGSRMTHSLINPTRFGTMDILYAVIHMIHTGIWNLNELMMISRYVFK